MYMLLFILACFEKTPQTDEDCAVYRDKCNSGCDLICGTVYEKEQIEGGDVCDLGCMDSGEQEADCLLVGEECQFVE